MTVLNRAGRVTQLFVSFDHRMATILSIFKRPSSFAFCATMGVNDILSRNFLGVSHIPESLQ
jgi:hypothetical protein